MPNTMKTAALRDRVVIVVCLVFHTPLTRSLALAPSPPWGEGSFSDHPFIQLSFPPSRILLDSGVGTLHKTYGKLFAAIFTLGKGF